MSETISDGRIIETTNLYGAKGPAGAVEFLQHRNVKQLQLIPRINSMLELRLDDDDLFILIIYDIGVNLTIRDLGGVFCSIEKPLSVMTLLTILPQQPFFNLALIPQPFPHTTCNTRYPA